jgi:methyl-accepting chemotaxis protein
VADVVNHFLQWRWFIVAAIVGTALNLINQWEAMVGVVAIDYPTLILTYIVPYLVSSMSAWQAKKSAK